MRYTTKTLLIFSFAIALVFAGLSAIDRGHRPDPSSESFTIDGVAFTPRWKHCNRTQNKTGLHAKPIVIENNYRGSNHISHEQTLFQYCYDDRFGDQTFDVSYTIDANFDSAWNEYLFQTIMSGGGNTGASAEVETSLDPPNRTLIIDIRQSFRRPAISKECRLKFKWNGVQFVLQDGE